MQGIVTSFTIQSSSKLAQLYVNQNQEVTGVLKYGCPKKFGKVHSETSSIEFTALHQVCHSMNLNKFLRASAFQAELLVNALQMELSRLPWLNSFKLQR